MNKNPKKPTHYPPKRTSKKPKLQKKKLHQPKNQDNMPNTKPTKTNETRIKRRRKAYNRKDKKRKVKNCYLHAWNERVKFRVTYLGSEDGASGPWVIELDALDEVLPGRLLLRSFPSPLDSGFVGFGWLCVWFVVLISVSSERKKRWRLRMNGICCCSDIWRVVNLKQLLWRVRSITLLCLCVVLCMCCWFVLC